MPSYTYTANVPNAPQLISDTQAPILQNFQSIGSIIAQDHVGFNAANGGTHTVVNLNNQASDPATVASGFLGLYTKQVAGVQQLFIERPGSPGTTEQISGGTGGQSGANGWTGLGGNTLMQYGLASATTSNTGLFTFNYPGGFPQFASSGYMVMMNSYTGVRLWPVWQSSSPTGFTCFVYQGREIPMGNNYIWSPILNTFYQLYYIAIGPKA